MLGVGRGDAEPLGESLCWKRPKVVWENIRYPETCSNPALCLLLSSLQRLRTCHLLSHGYSQLAARSVWPAHPPRVCQSPVCGGSTQESGCLPKAGSFRGAMSWCLPVLLRVMLVSTPAVRPTWLVSGNRRSTSPWPVSTFGLKVDARWRGVRSQEALGPGCDGQRPAGAHLRPSQLWALYAWESGSY